MPSCGPAPASRNHGIVRSGPWSMTRSLTRFQAQPKPRPALGTPRHRCGGPTPAPSRVVEQVTAWSESLHGPSHYMVRVIAWSESSPGPWSESSHGPSPCMVRVIAWSESLHVPSHPLPLLRVETDSEPPKLGGRSRAAPPPPRARACTHTILVADPKVVGAAPPARHRSATLPTRAKLALSRPRPGADLGPTDQTHHRPPRKARKGRRGVDAAHAGT